MELGWLSLCLLTGYTGRGDNEFVLSEKLLWVDVETEGIEAWIHSYIENSCRYRCCGAKGGEDSEWVLCKCRKKVIRGRKYVWVIGSGGDLLIMEDSGMQKSLGVWDAHFECKFYFIVSVVPLWDRCRQFLSNYQCWCCQTECTPDPFLLIASILLHVACTKICHNARYMQRYQKKYVMWNVMLIIVTKFSS